MSVRECNNCYSTNTHIYIDHTFGGGTKYIVRECYTCNHREVIDRIDIVSVK